MIQHSKLKLMSALFLFGQIGYVFSSDPAPLTSALGELIRTQPTSRLQLKFPYTQNPLNSAYVNTGLIGSGTVTASSNFAVISSGVTASSSAVMSSRYLLNYQAGQGSACTFTAIFTTPGIATSTQIIGMGNFGSTVVPPTGSSSHFGDIQDGFFFGYNGTSFGVFQYTDKVKTFVASTAWNVDHMDGTGPSGMTLNTADGNTYKIEFCWLGFGIINFYIATPGSTGDPTIDTFQLVHVIQYPNANTVTSVLNPSLRLFVGVNNGSTTSNITIQTPCMNGFTEGKVNTAIDVRNSIYTTAGTAVSNFAYNTSLSIYNKWTFGNPSGTIVNETMVYVDKLSILVSASVSTVWTLYLNPTLGATLTFNDVSTSTSVVQYSITQTSVTSGIALASFYVDSNRAQIIDLTDYEIVLAPGDELVVAANANGAVTVYTALSWHERF